MNDNDVQAMVLGQMKEAWQKTPVNADDNPPPPGEYTAEVIKSAVITTGSNGETRVKLLLTYAILDPEIYDDRTISTWLPLDDPEKLAPAKSTLYKLGIREDDLLKIPGLVSQAVATKVLIKVTASQSGGRTYHNAYLKSVLPHDKTVIKESVSAGGSDDIPF